MKYREITKKLRKLQCAEIPRRSGGSHRKWFNPSTNRGTIIPDHGAKDLKLSTVRAIIKQLGIEWQDFKKM
jgi:predicted RNA binding protein YcfA (HicA-like mRNA interferase family)